MSIAAVFSSTSFDYTSVQIQFSQQIQARKSGQDQPTVSASLADDRVELTRSSGGSNAQAAPSNTIAADFKTLGQALQAGNLADAQQAFATLKQDLQGTDQAGTANSGQTASGSTSKFARDFAALDQALQSGNLSDAQTAYASVQQDVQNAQASQGHHRHHHRHHHHGHHEGGSDSSGSTIAGLLSSLTSSGSESSAKASGKNSLTEDFGALGQALQSGDLTAAQKAYASVQQDLLSTTPGKNNSWFAGGALDVNIQFTSITYTTTSLVIAAGSGSGQTESSTGTINLGA